MKNDWQNISEKHGPMVWRVLYRILRTHADSLDTYQDVMLEAFRASQLKSINNWPGYLRWLAVRRGFDLLRKRNRRNAVIDESQEINGVPHNSSSPASMLEMVELKARLRSELAQIPAQQAEAFWLRFIEEMSYSEIATQMSLDSNSVGVLIHRARNRVQIALADLKPNQRTSKELSQ